MLRLQLLSGHPTRQVTIPGGLLGRSRKIRWRRVLRREVDIVTCSLGLPDSLQTGLNLGARGTHLVGSESAHVFLRHQVAPSCVGNPHVASLVADYQGWAEELSSRTLSPVRLSRRVVAIEEDDLSDSDLLEDSAASAHRSPQQLLGVVLSSACFALTLILNRRANAELGTSPSGW